MAWKNYLMGCWNYCHSSCPVCNPKAVECRQALPIHQGILSVLHFLGVIRFHGRNLLCIANKKTAPAATKAWLILVVPFNTSAINGITLDTSCR